MKISLGENPAGVFDAGASEPFQFLFAVAVAGELGFDLHGLGKAARQDGQDEDGDHDDDQGDAVLGAARGEI